MADDAKVAPLVAAFCGLAAVAVGATLLLPARLLPLTSDVLLFAVGYALVFLVAQRMGFLLHWHGHATRVSIEEFVLVGGLLLLPSPLLVATVLSAATVHQVVRRRAAWKAAFNVAQYALAASAAALLDAGLVALRVPPLAAALSGPFAFACVSLASTALLFARLDEEPFVRVFRSRFAQWTLLTAVIGAALGLSAYALWALSPWAILAIVPVFLLLSRFGRLTEWAEEEVRVHKALAAAGTRVAATGDFDDSARALLDTCADVFGAGEARLTLPLPAGGERSWSWHHEQGASAHGMRVNVPMPGGPDGELVVYPRPGARSYGARDRHLLAIVAGSAASAATGAHTLLELKEANRRLSNANRELEEFTLWTTHDMREPLRSVGQLAQVLHEDMDILTDDEARELAKRMQNGAETLKDRIKALHEFSRVVQEDGEYGTVDMQRLLDEAREGLAARIAERRAAIDCRTPLPHVRGQAARLAKVLGNLLENALKYNDKERPVVVIAAQEWGEEWEFRIRDNGPGIDPAFHERAFQLFQRGPNAKAASGSGAGLAIVKRIVEQHGGRIWIADGAPGEGVEFRFTLPKAAAVQVPAQPAALTP
jgi:signal transduction histidine kinase